MPTIYNQANVTYHYGREQGKTGTAASNQARLTLQTTLAVTKSTLQECYNVGDLLTYILTVTNQSSSMIPTVTLTDNLGSYTFLSTSGPMTLTPLDYVGPTKYYYGSVYMGELSVTQTANGISFQLESLPAGTAAILVYTVKVNEFAGLAAGSSITNTISWTDACSEDIQTATCTIPVCVKPDIVIEKKMCPDPVVCGDTVTYTFTFLNYGNEQAYCLQLTDQFTPAPTITAVYWENHPVSASMYTYSGGLLTLPNAANLNNNILAPADYPAGTVGNPNCFLWVPPASYTQDPVTGEVTVTPGEAEVRVVGVL